MSVFENRVLRRMFGQKRDEVRRGWRKLHNEKLHGFQTLSVIRYSRNQMGKVQKPSNSEYYTPSSEPFRIYLHNEELHNLYSSPNIIRMIRSGKMRRQGM
jgi:hypothetical protein